MSLAARGAKFAFSSEIEATYGSGVNVFSGAGWGTEGHLQRLQNEMQFRRLVRKLFSLTPQQEKMLGDSVRALRSAFARDLLHRLAHRKAVPAAILGSQLREDPMTLLELIPTAVQILFRGRRRTS